MGVAVVGVATAMLGLLSPGTEAVNVVAIDYRNIEILVSKHIDYRDISS